MEGKIRKALDKKEVQNVALKQYQEDKLRKNEERRQKILEAKVAKAAAKALKIQQIKERKQSLLTECSSGEDRKNDLRTAFENQKLMNQKFLRENLDEKMAKVAERKQKNLEEKQQKARKSRENIYSAQNGWQKTSNGWVKKFEPLNEGENIKCLIRYRSYTTRDKKSSKDDLEKKLNKAAMKKQMILEEKK